MTSRSGSQKRRFTTTTKEREARAKRNREARARGENVVDLLGRPVRERLANPPTDLTEDLIDAICVEVAKGAMPHRVALAMGISRKTFRDWMEKGKKGEGSPIFALGFTRIEAARAQMILTAEQRIFDAGQKEAWQASARLLESQASDDWMRTEKRISEGGEGFKDLLEEMRTLREKNAREAQQAQDATRSASAMPPVVDLPEGATAPPLPSSLAGN